LKAHQIRFFYNDRIILNPCPIKSKDFIDKANERSILKVHLMSIGRGLIRREEANDMVLTNSGKNL